MSITTAGGPLAPAAPSSANYELQSPDRQIYFQPVPRRVRGTFGGQTIVDSDNAMLLHETDTMVTLYFPVADVQMDYLTSTDLSTRCPFKGNASYWTLAVAGQEVENAMWGYETPIESAPWLEGYVAFYWAAMDTWLDEDEEVFGHFRDPYHRIDVRPLSRRVTVGIGEQTVAESTNAFVLSETGMPNRYYIPESDIKTELFTETDSSTHCPYKGQAEYRAFSGDSSIGDIAWLYLSPFDEVSRVAGCWAFYDNAAVISVT